MTAKDLSGLFHPDRVAVIGATDREGSVGRALWENLSSFDGEVVPVNPNRDTVFDRERYPAIGAVPGAGSIDLAVVAVPAEVAVVREVGAAGVGNVVVLRKTASTSDASADG